MTRAVIKLFSEAYLVGWNAGRAVPRDATPNEERAAMLGGLADYQARMIQHHYDRAQKRKARRTPRS